VNSLILSVGADERVKNRENTMTVLCHAREDIPELRLTLGIAMPFGKHGRRHFNVPAQLFGGVASKEKTIEKGGFPLRKIEVLSDFYRNDLYHRGHKENRSLPKKTPASSSTPGSVPRDGQLPFFLHPPMSMESPANHDVAARFQPP
jgi:hypothetical protein